jgi:hypothetical protein
MSMTFELIPENGKTVLRSKKEVTALLSKMFDIKFLPEEDNSENVTDFNLTIKNPRINALYPEPIEIYLDHSSHNYFTSIVTQAFTQEEQEIFDHELGLIAKALSCNIFDAATGESAPPEKYISDSITSESLQSIRPQEELKKETGVFASALKKTNTF